MVKLIFVFALLSLASYGQIKTMKTSKLLTSKYSGVYSCGTDIQKGQIGTISVYPETDSTILFYIDLNRGAPSYNMGSLYGRVKIKSDTGVFSTKAGDAEKGCKWIFYFTKNSLTIKTLDEQYGCGFGGNVYADGKFRKISSKYPAFFEDMEGKKIYFEITKPEDYYKNE